MRRSAAVGALEAVQRAVEPDQPVPLERPQESLRTEFSFLLPRGYKDASGAVHREGVMRLATARDELVPLRDDRVSTLR